MNTKLQLISLTLTNIVGTDSEVNLLSNEAGTNNSAFDSYYQISFLDRFPLGKYSLDYEIGIAQYTYDVNGTLPVANINNLILDLNTGLSSYALFSYEVSSVPNYYILTVRILDSSFVPIQFLAYS
jgi:hypothetical protein